MTDLPAKQTVQLRAFISGFGGSPVPMNNPDDRVQYADSFVIECGEHSFTETRLDDAVAAAAAMMARHGAVLADDTQKTLAEMVEGFCAAAPEFDGEPAPAPMAM
jgi:hypothetical protein